MPLASALGELLGDGEVFGLGGGGLPGELGTVGEQGEFVETCLLAAQQPG